MATMTEQTVRQYLEEQADLWPPTAMEIAEHTGIPISSLYVALKGIGATRTRIDRNQFGYVLPDDKPLDFPSVETTLGTVGGKSWADSAESAIKTVSGAALLQHITAAEYAEGFESIGYRFLE